MFREAAVNNPTFARDHIGDAQAKACLVRLLPARPPVEHVKMHHRQTEIPPEPQGKACLAAALAANDDDPARGQAPTASRAIDRDSKSSNELPLFSGN